LPASTAQRSHRWRIGSCCSRAIRSSFESSGAAMGVRLSAVGAGIPAVSLRLRRIRWLFTNAEIERRPFVDPAFGPDPPAVALDHAPHRGEADTDAFEFVLAVQALKYLEQLSPVTRVEPDAVVAHEEHELPVVFSLRSDM